jgi:hypothetical protein
MSSAHSRHDLPADLLARPDFIAACAGHDFAEVFRLVQKCTGTTNSRIAYLTEMNPSRVGEIRNHRRQVRSAEVITRICDGLRIPGHLLGILPRHWETDHTPPSPPALASADTSLAHAYAELTVERHSYGYHGQKPLTLLADMAKDFNDVRPLLASVRSAPERARLCMASAQLAGMIGIILHDLGHRREAHGWFHTARLAAKETGDPSVTAWILAREAMVPLNFGAPRAAADLAMQARAAAGNRPTAPAALACAVASRAYALLGRTDDAREALSQAETISERLSATAAADTWFGYPEQKHHVHASQTLTHLGETRRISVSQYVKSA